MKQMFFLTVLAVSGAPAVPASVIVFSNFQRNALLCECDNGSGRPLGTLADSPRERFTIGNAFTVPAENDFLLDQIRLSAAMISGSVNSLKVLLQTDRHLLPDVLLEAFQIDGQMAPFGHLYDRPPQVADSRLRPTLLAGHTYWLVVTTTDPQTGAAWYDSNTNDIGPVGGAINNDTLCCVRNDGRNAFEVLGTPVSTQSTPEPASLFLIAVGELLLMAVMLARKLSGANAAIGSTRPRRQ